MADDNDLIRTPPISAGIIRHAVWLYVRFTLSFRDVEDLLAGRGWMSPMKRAAMGLKFGAVLRP